MEELSVDCRMAVRKQETMAREVVYNGAEGQMAQRMENFWTQGNTRWDLKVPGKTNNKRSTLRIINSSGKELEQPREYPPLWQAEKSAEEWRECWGSYAADLMSWLEVGEGVSHAHVSHTHTHLFYYICRQIALTYINSLQPFPSLSHDQIMTNPNP